jgi:hypothetical protein
VGLYCGLKVRATMQQLVNVNPTSEHWLFLHLFVSNAGGW